MPRILPILSAVVASAVIAAPISAQSADQDVRCWMASNVFAKNEKDPQKKQIAAIAMVFYLGRIDARMSMTQLKAAVATQGKLIKQPEYGPLMTSCATKLRDKELALRAMAAPPPKAK